MHKEVFMAEFFNNFTLVSQNVFVLFLLMAVGFAANKFKIINDNGAKCLSDLALRIVNPAVIISGFIREYDPELMGRYLITLAISILAHVFLIIAANFLIFDKVENKEKVYRFAVIFSNAGYMAIPLQQAILGGEGVFFGSAYIAGFNIVLWTYGALMMSGNKGGVSVKKALFNPGIVSVCIGMIIFVLSVPVPEAVNSAISHVAGLNTAIPMMIIGYYFATADFKGAVTDLKSYYCLLLRLVVLPVIGIVVVRLCGFRGVEFVTVAIAMSTPCAAATTMFSAKYDRDVALSARIVSFSTLVSILTMPVIVALSMNYA